MSGFRQGALVSKACADSILPVENDADQRSDDRPKSAFPEPSGALRRHPRMKRLSIMTIAAISLSATSAQAGGPSLDQMRRQTADIATRYIAVWSSDADRSVAAVPYIYGKRTRFYGRNVTQAELMAEKQRAVQQWPIRQYSHRPDTMKVICNEKAFRCVASSIIDYQASNPARGASKRGAARFNLGVDFTDPSGKPKILFEGGTIGHRTVS